MSYDTIKAAADRRARDFPSVGTHECAVEGCGKLIPSKLLMCADHWRQVPMPLQRAVWQTWREVQRQGIGEDTWKPYEAAREAAIRSAPKVQS